IDTGMVSLMSMALNMYPMSGYVFIKEEGWVLGAVCLFTIIIAIFLMNLLIAQLNQAYQ
ncbi:unnamed protein product, partial [Symbiodinium pilosum]